MQPFGTRSDNILKYEVPMAIIVFKCVVFVWKTAISFLLWNYPEISDGFVIVLYEIWENLWML